MQTAIDDVFPLARRRIRRRARRTALLGALLMVGPVGLMLYVGLPLDDLMGSPLGLGLLVALYLLVRGIGRMRALSQAAIVLDAIVPQRLRHDVTVAGHAHAGADRGFCDNHHSLPNYQANEPQHGSD